jgi:hypothetical protein
VHWEAFYFPSKITCLAYSYTSLKSSFIYIHTRTIVLFYENYSTLFILCFFKLVNKFLGVLFGGALLTRLHDIIDYPTQIPQILAESMPSMANFFIKIIMLRTLTGFAMEILNLFRLLLVIIKRKWYVLSSTGSRLYCILTYTFT